MLFSRRERREVAERGESVILVWRAEVSKPWAAMLGPTKTVGLSGPEFKVRATGITGHFPEAYRLLGC